MNASNMHSTSQASLNRVESIVRSLVTPLHHPAVYTFAGIWGTAALTLLLTGNAINVLFGVVVLVGILVFMWLTSHITGIAGEPTINEDTVRGSQARWRIILQLALVLAVIGITAYESLTWHGITVTANIPLWTPFLARLGEWGNRFLAPEVVGDAVLAIVNPVRYALIPLVGLILLGVAPHQLGLRGGRRTWWVVLLWCSIGLMIWTVQLLSGQLALHTARRWLVANLLQNGFSEEFLFRGALQTRLQLLMSTPWALVVQALIFAVWHLGAGAGLMDGNVVLGIAANIVAIGPYGLAYGYIFLRTRNLVACSLVHAGLNSMF